MADALPHVKAGIAAGMIRRDDPLVLTHAITGLTAYLARVLVLEQGRSADEAAGVGRPFLPRGHPLPRRRPAPHGTRRRLAAARRRAPPPGRWCRPRHRRRCHTDGRARDADLPHPLRRLASAAGRPGHGPGTVGGGARPTTEMHVRMGWAFRARVPRTAITGARPVTGRVGGIGVHGWRGRWLVNGSMEKIVGIDIDPAVRAVATGIPVHLHYLSLSLENPDAFLAALKV